MENISIESQSKNCEKKPSWEVPEDVLHDYCMPIDLRDKELDAVTTEHISNKEYSDVLLIVTGGTLCMVHTDNGYEPAKGLAQRLKAYKTFYDKEESEKL